MGRGRVCIQAALSYLQWSVVLFFVYFLFRKISRYFVHSLFQTLQACDMKFYKGVEAVVVGVYSQLEVLRGIKEVSCDTVSNTCSCKKVIC